MNECVHVEKATDRGYLFVKRLFDVVASLMALSAWSAHGGTLMV